MKELPIYDITIEDDAEIQGVSKISLVDVPAIGVNWIALRKVQLKLQDVFGYETQHFDICPGAQKTFENYSKMQLDEDTIGMIRSAAQNADNVFEIEKKVIEAGKATREDLEQVRILVADFKDIISEIDKITNQPQNVDYMDGHIKVVQDLLPKTMMAVRMKKPKMSFAKRECFGCPPNGDGTRVNGEPDKRCKDTKGDSSGGRTKAAGWSTPKQTYDPSKKTSGPSDKGPAIGENYDMKNFQSGVAAPNGRSMSNIYGPEYQNESLLKNNIESGATVISTKNGVQAKSYETGTVFTQADVRDRSLKGQYGTVAKSSTPFTPLQVDQYSKLAYYGDSKIGAPLLDKEIKHIEEQNGKSFTIRKVGDKTEIIEKRTQYKSIPSGGREKIGEGERKIGHIKDGKLYVSGWNGPDWMNSGYGSDYKTRTNPREQRETDLQKLFGY